MDRLRDALAHESRRADGVVEAGIDAPLENRGNPTALFRDQQSVGVVELDLARGVRAIAAFVLEALETPSIDTAVGLKARHQEARQPARRLRQDQERIAHRRGKEPLLAAEAIFAPWAARG